ncbi:dnaJ homolog subfamily C member 27-like [Clavelina lepadiformis]|uniref:J domain-containing protein n=1 Tax=Clavelina lepadiformis TaxID=159417 RepID=A0ABP0GZS4_CLALP
MSGSVHGNINIRKGFQKRLRVKIISMGNAEVGKSCIIKRYCERRFVSKYLPTVGIDYGVTKVHVNQKELKVNIFDMAGHPYFFEVRNEFYRDTQAALLVFDVCDRRSFESLESWLVEMKQEMGRTQNIDNVLFFVCANKIDKVKRDVSTLEGRLWAESKGFHYFETSAASGEGINEMFQDLFNKLVEMSENGGCPPVINTNLGFTKEQADAILRIRNGRDNYEKLGIHHTATRDEINRAYRKLAVLLHPDKNVAPGSEDAFKILVNARTSLLHNK